MRRLGFLLAVLLAIAAGVGSASAVVGGSGTTENGSDAVQPDGRGASLPTTVADPDGRAPWGVRVYQSKTGLTCPEAGRTKGGDFGRLDGDGQFTPLDIEAAGSCADLAKEPLSLAIEHHLARDGRPARAVIFGATTSGVVSLSMRTADGSRDVPIVRNAYITVVREEALRDAQLTATFKDGTIKSYALRPMQSPLVEPPSPETTG